MTDRQADFSRARDAARLPELAHALGAALADDARERLLRYMELALQWNRKLDLTAARGACAQLEVLLGDALVLADPARTPLGSRVLDVGSGAGAPALALALARPDLHVTLLEPLHKRVAFLRSALGTLGWTTRATVLEQKLDPHAPQVSGAFDAAMSRATFAPELWLPAGLALAPRAYVFLAAQAAPAAPSGAQLQLEHEYALPWSGAPRRLVVYTRG